uniref:Replication protein A 70 kDa DNA-binding subunit n=1 Tax=Dermatophagoides pteronyssinus TaxID=6956 RepID=A0A6P6XML8_DERPT|nr:replication protein A 70 kDa DNA-binding subunit-like isoform X2 [Dermatophagoides pteronyssinus]
MGKLFRFDVYDKEFSEIRITAFNEDCDRFFNLIQIDQCYRICYGHVKHSNHRYSTLSNAYEIHTTNSTIIEPLKVSPFGPRKIIYNFIPFSSLLNNNSSNTVIDCIGIIDSINPVRKVYSSYVGHQVSLRNISIFDYSQTNIQIAIWQKMADDFCGESGQIIALKNVKICSFNGLSLSCTSMTTITIDPDIPEAIQLRNWYHTNNSTLIQNVKLFYIEQIKETSNFKKTFDCLATIVSTSFKHHPAYRMCPNGEQCKRKLSTTGEGELFCGYCGWLESSSLIHYKWGLRSQFQINDMTGSIWIIVFGDQTEKLIGKTAEEISQMTLQTWLNLFYSTIWMQQYVFTIEKSIYQSKNCYNIIAINRIDTKMLIQQIRKLE